MKLFLDDERTPAVVGLKDDEWKVVRSVWVMKVLLWVSSKVYSFVTHVSLDHDLGAQPTGYDLVKWMAEKNVWPSNSVYIHTMNPVGRDNIKSVVDRYFRRSHGVL